MKQILVTVLEWGSDLGIKRWPDFPVEDDEWRIPTMEEILSYVSSKRRGFKKPHVRYWCCDYKGNLGTMRPLSPKSFKEGSNIDMSARLRFVKDSSQQCAVVGSGKKTISVNLIHQKL